MEIVATLENIAGQAWQLLYQPWTLYQAIFIFACFVVAKAISRAIEPKLEGWVRTIKGNPGLLRMFAALLRRTEWIIFIPLLWLVLQVTLEFTWPSRTYFMSIGLTLATAWLIIAVLSRVIRNRTFARLIAWIGWVLVALTVLGMLDPTLTALDSVAFSFGEFRLSLLAVIKAVIAVVGLLWLATVTGNFVENRISAVEDLTPSLRVLLGKVIKITLVVAALAVALSSVGIDLTALTVFSGAVGVGIGFGLQKVVSNFISGIIILLDKSIKPGDTISLGETFGWIRELRARFVSVVTRDGKEYLIPNEDLITQQVVNWSFTDKLIRLDVTFGVAYGSNPHDVSKLAIDAAKKVDRVSTIKPPVCWMTEFGDSSLNFVLRFWISDPQNGLTNIRGKVMLGLWDTFDENGINIPFPHREIIMRTPVEVQTSEQSGRQKAAKNR